MRLVGLALVGLVSLASGSHADQLLVLDDFESYRVGEFPTTGGWELVYVGSGPLDQVVVDTYSVSGERGYQAIGRRGQASVAERSLGVDVEDWHTIVFQTHVLCPVHATRAAGFGLWNRHQGRRGVTHAGIQICPDGTVRAYHTGSPAETLAVVDPGVFHHVRGALDTGTRRFDVWVDGRLVGRDLPAAEGEIEALQMGVGPGPAAYFDDVLVRVERLGPDVRLRDDLADAMMSRSAPLGELPSTWGEVKSLYR